MTKTIHEFFALNEDEYRVTIVSYMDIFSEKYHDMVRLALEKHDLREMNMVRKENFQQNPVQFPQLSFGTLYFVEAILGNLPRGGYEQLRQEISQATQIRLPALFVSEDGDVPKNVSTQPDADALLKTAMGEHPLDKGCMDDPALQNLVGQKSVHSLMKAMDERRENSAIAAEAIKESKVYRTTHKVLAEATGESYRKGIYEFNIVEGNVKVVGMNNESEATPLPTLERLNEEIQNHKSPLLEKYFK
ncbi:hypothetical protein CL653_03200 [bacterium]|nr:hypothetical protein [bacterium]